MGSWFQNSTWFMLIKIGLVERDVWTQHAWCQSLLRILLQKIYMHVNLAYSYGSISQMMNICLGLTFFLIFKLYFNWFEIYVKLTSTSAMCANYLICCSARVCPFFCASVAPCHPPVKIIWRQCAHYTW
jgi:hypothetical protein